MENIQNKAINTYLENLEYLKSNHAELHDKVVILSELIEKNMHTERYHLEYINEDNQFDIFDTVSSSYLYNKNPAKFIKEAIKNSNFDKMSSIDLLNANLYNVSQKPLIDESLPTLDKTFLKIKQDIFEYSSIFKKSTIDEKRI